MGVRADGVHVYGVLRGWDEGTQAELMDVVEATSYCIVSNPEGPLLTLSDLGGIIVAQYQPEQWRDVLTAIPGVDDPVLNADE
jgi:hypothetical protein